MNLSKADNRILRLLKILLGLCLATPLLASASFIFPYTAPKIFAFRILVELAAAIYLYLVLKCSKIFCHSGRSVSEEPESRIKKHGCRIKSGMTISLVILIFLLFNFFSAVFGVDLYTSWWGNLERGMGVWSLAHFVAWFLMLSVVFKEPKDWRGLMRLSAATGAIVAATALIQRFGGAGGLLPATGRIYGLIGNAGLLGSYLLFNTFLAGYLVFESVGWKKWLFAISALLLVLSLFLTGTRGAYLGLLAGAIIFLVLMFFKPTTAVIPARFDESKARRAKAGIQTQNPGPGSRLRAGMTNKKKIFIFIFLALLFVLAASLFWFRPISLNDATAQSRLILWQDSWQAWQVRPLLGFGPENFETGITKYLSPRLAQYENYAADRAHNFILDYGVALGWLGLLGYLGVVGAAVFALWRARKTDFVLFAVFTSLLTAYLVQNFFIFDSFVSYLMLFFALAMVRSNFQRKSLSVIPARFDESKTRRAKAGIQVEPGPGSRVKPGMTPMIGFFLFAIFIIFVIYSYNLKPLLAAYRAEQILSLSVSEATQAGPLLSETLTLDTFASPEIAYQVVLDYIDKIGQDPTLAKNEEFYNIATEELLKSINLSPGQVRNYLALAWLDLYFSGSAPQRMNDAIDLGIKAKELSPNKKDAYLVLAAAYALSGRGDKAQEIISQALAIDGKMGEEVRLYYEKLK